MYIYTYSNTCIYTLIVIHAYIHIQSYKYKYYILQYPCITLCNIGLYFMASMCMIGLYIIIYIYIYIFLCHIHIV